MANYNSAYTGAQIDTAVGKALNPQTTPTAGSSELITSGGVKSAIDDLFVVSEDISYNYTIAANAGLDIKASQITFTPPTGYTGVGFVSINTGLSGVAATNFRAYATGNLNMVTLRNMTNASVSDTLVFRLLYKKN